MLVDFSPYYLPEPNTGCWLWEGEIDKGGYGRLLGRSAHQLLYFLHTGIKSDHKRVLDHRCRMRSCINPDHLELVTQKENVSRGNTGQYQRDKTHCPQWHAYDEENTTWKKGRRHRQCRQCGRERQRIEYALR